MKKSREQNRKRPMARAWDGDERDSDGDCERLDSWVGGEIESE